MEIEKVNNPGEGTGEVVEDGEVVVVDPGTEGGEGGEGTGAGKPEATFEIEGEKIPLSKIKEWKEGSLRQDDYTKKTQTLADQRKSLQYLMTLDNFLKRNPDKAVAVRELLTGGEKTPGGEKFNWAEMSEEQQVKFLEGIAQSKGKTDQRLKALEILVRGFAQKTQNQTQEVKMEKELSEQVKRLGLDAADLKDDREDFEDKVLAVLEIKPDADIKEVADAIYKKLTTRNQTRIQNYLKTKKKKGIEGKGGAATSTKPKPATEENLVAAVDTALKESMND